MRQINDEVNAQIEIISVHVPKTAGSTFKKVLLGIYGHNNVILDYPTPEKRRYQALENLHNCTKVIHGHFPANKYDKYYPEARKIIWLRNPIITLFSRYYFLKKVYQKHYASKMQEYLQQNNNVDLMQFAEIPENQNLITKKYIKGTNLTDFYFIGIQEFFETDIKEVKEMLKWPELMIGYKNKNISVEYQHNLQNFLANKQKIARLAKLNQEDIEIYQEALSFREKRLINIGLLYGNNPKQKQIELTQIPQLKLNPERIYLETINIPNNSEPVISIGNIDKVIVNSEGLQISGWVASLYHGIVKKMQVTVAGREIDNFKINCGLPSPGVKKKFFYLDKAETARFSIEIPLLPEEILQYQDCLLTLTSLFRGGKGTILLKPINPCLPIPNPKYIKSIGYGDQRAFANKAFKFLGYFIQIAGLQPTNKVLDIGCGVGRIAHSLAYYLDPTTQYEGFDISDNLVSWARQNITPVRANFTFQYLNIYHSMYNPSGSIMATYLSFPYQNASFDFVCAISVFIHLHAAEIRNYLHEIYRVLRKGGRCFLTCFLLNSESRHLIAKGKISRNIIYELEESFAKNPDLPEESIGFPENLLLNWIEEQGFIVVNKTLGFWCGRQAFVCEDFLVIEKV
ncbi:MAG: methyltransferase domain-containing protein [Trichodesmium sp. MAG_R03]|nr:methyltransferase domain-containing protein [Trichodesmium sp. MAG_R03]